MPSVKPDDGGARVTSGVNTVEGREWGGQAAGVQQRWRHGWLGAPDLSLTRAPKTHE